MAIDLKYGEVVTERGTIGDKEPVVLFRGQDEMTPRVLEIYRDLCKEAGSPEHHLTGIDNARDEILRWQASNHTQVPRSDG